MQLVVFQSLRETPQEAFGFTSNFADFLEPIEFTQPTQEHPEVLVLIDSPYRLVLRVERAGLCDVH